MMVIYGRWSLEMFFQPLLKILADSPIYSSSQSTLSHLNLYMTPLFCWLGLCPLGTWGGLWWCDHLSGVHQSHIACKCFCSSHWVHDGMGPQCEVLDHYYYWTQLGCCCFFSSWDEWMHFSVWLYWWPSQDIYISLGIDADVSLPFAIHQVLNRPLTLIFQGKFAGERCCYGVTHKPYSGQPVHGKLRGQGTVHSTTTPTLWKRFVDDTFIIIKRSSKESFLEHLNSVDDNIHFTCEEPNEDGSIAFLDMLITPVRNGRLNTSVYRKEPHTDQYLHWDSHHSISAKYSVVGTLFHRAEQPVQHLVNCKRKWNICINP